MDPKPITKAIDCHIHLFSTPLRLRTLNWSEGSPITTPHTIDNYRTQAPNEIVRAVFVEVDTDSVYIIPEIEDASSTDFVGGITSWAPMKNMDLFLEMIGKYDKGLVRGFRMLIQDKEHGTCLKKDFVESVKWIGKKGYLFELGMNVHSKGVRQLEDSYDLMKLTHNSGIVFVIDHMGKPDLGKEKPDPAYIELLTRIAKEYPTTCIKLSGMLTELEEPLSDSELEERLKPYFEFVLGSFGAKRIMWGSDWPVVTMSVRPGSNTTSWFEICVEILQKVGCSREDMELIFYANAKDLYKIKGL